MWYLHSVVIPSQIEGRNAIIQEEEEQSHLLLLFYMMPYENNINLTSMWKITIWHYENIEVNDMFQVKSTVNHLNETVEGSTCLIS